MMSAVKNKMFEKKIGSSLSNLSELLNFQERCSNTRHIPAPKPNIGYQRTFYRQMPPLFGLSKSGTAFFPSSSLTLEVINFFWEKPLTLINTKSMFVQYPDHI